MPFDFATHPNAEAIRLVEKTEAILATEGNWATFEQVGKDGSRCVYGALAHAAGYYHYIISRATPAMRVVSAVMEVEAARRLGIAQDQISDYAAVDYNNADTTTHADFLAAVKVRLYEIA